MFHKGCMLLMMYKFSFYEFYSLCFVAIDQRIPIIMVVLLFSCIKPHKI